MTSLQDLRSTQTKARGLGKPLFQAPLPLSSSFPFGLCSPGPPLTGLSSPLTVPTEIPVCRQRSAAPVGGVSRKRAGAFGSRSHDVFLASHSEPLFPLGLPRSGGIIAFLAGLTQNPNQRAGPRKAPFRGLRSSVFPARCSISRRPFPSLAPAHPILARLTESSAPPGSGSTGWCARPR